MPTEKPIISFVIDEDLAKELDDYRFDNRFKTQSEAIRHLIRYALDKLHKPHKA